MVVSIGEVLWDNLPSGRRLGGAPANFVFHVKQLGLSSCVVSAVGNDLSGHELIDRLDLLGVEYRLAKVDSPTGEVMVDLDEYGIPIYKICEDAAWDNIPFTDEIENLAISATVVCFGMLAQRNDCSRNTIMRFLKSVSPGCLRVFDVNLRQNYYNRQLVEDSLRYTDVLKLNDEELEVLKGLLNIDGDNVGTCRNIMDIYGVDVVVMTCGDKGSYVIDKNDVSYRETPVVDVVDTVGAGDAFTAAFVVATQRGLDIKESHRLAVVVATSVCMAAGATPELPETVKRLFG